MCIRCTDDGNLSTISVVPKSLLASGDLVFEAFATEDSEVGTSCWEWAIHPNKCVVVHRNRNLVVHTSLIELVGVKLTVFGLCRVSGLIKMTMNPINSNQKDWNIVVIPVLGPNDLGGV